MIHILNFYPRQVFQRMNNLSFASRTAWDNMHLQGGCVLQLDYNVLLFLREIAFLVIFSEKVLLQTIKIQGAVFPTCLWNLDSESPCSAGT